MVGGGAVLGPHVFGTPKLQKMGKHFFNSQSILVLKGLITLYVVSLAFLIF